MYTDLTVLPALFPHLHYPHMNLTKKTASASKPHQMHHLHYNEGLYSFSINFPSLGASHNQTSRLPAGMSLIDTTFGRKIVKEGSAAAAVSPSKTREEVEREAEEGKELYRKVQEEGLEM